jgi:hypothetical protein
MENSTEPFYFTEKFVQAVIAGCVPIYHASTTIRETVLRGATWVDPADFMFNGNRTVAAALSKDQKEVAAANQEWLMTNTLVAATKGENILRSLADRLRFQAGG